MNDSSNSTSDTRLICTVDVVLLTLRDEALHVVLQKREREPFAGVLALPGGYIHPQDDSDATDAAARVLRALPPGFAFPGC